MTDENNDRRHAVALFRYGLIADLVHTPSTKGLYRRLAEKAQADYTIPGSARTRIAPETLRDWLKRYRHGGFEALMPKPRADRGRSRALPDAVVERLLSLKEAKPKLSVPLLIREARATGQIPEELPLPPSTVHRLLARHGLMRKPHEQPTERDRRRFAFQKAGELWMSDVMHGPTVFVGDRTRRKTYLIAFLDDATRVIPYAAFALSENTQTFLPVFKQALMRRGLPLRLYVDNGANYRSQQLALVCAKLGIALIHARAYQPQGKGKLERWFRTLRAQLLTRVTPEDTRSLEALNRRLWAWVEGEYHHTPHRSLEGQTPLERWASRADEVHFPDPTLDLDEVFLFETQRTVQKDRTVSLQGVVYEYRKHFAFTRFPFETERDPDALFASNALSEAHARLNHLLELRGIGLVTGEVGSGKTTICRKVASALHPGLYRLFYVPLSTGHVMDMYKSIGNEPSNAANNAPHAKPNPAG